MIFRSNPLQVAYEVRRVLPAIGRILRQTGRNDAAQRRRYVRSEARHVWWVCIEDSCNRSGVRVSGKCAPAGQHLVEHRTEREQVGARIGIASLELFGRHVLRRAEQLTVEGYRALR